MTIAATIEFPKEDVKSLMRQMERARKELGKSFGASVLMAMKYILQSVAKSTKIAEPYRAYRHVGASRSGKLQAYQVTTKYQTPRRKGKALRRSWQGPWRGQMIYAKNEQELKQRPALIVAMRGLAAESWKQAGDRANIRVPKKMMDNKTGARNMRIMKKAAHRWVAVDKRLTGDDPFIQLTNNLKYIGDALVGGESSISTSLERAARSMEKSLDNQIAKKFAA